MPFSNVVRHLGLAAVLAEDDPNDRLLIRRTIERLGIIHRLATVSSGEEVISYLEGDPRFADCHRYPAPDLLILDQFMPRWSGLDVLLWIRSSRRFEALPVVILSLGLTPVQMQEAALLKAACCPKTAQLEEMPDAVLRALRIAPPANRAAFKPKFPEALCLRSRLLGFWADGGQAKRETESLFR